MRGKLEEKVVKTKRSPNTDETQSASNTDEAQKNQRNHRNRVMKTL